ncbi:MAG: ROK family protein [Caulobacteraceae bacterium]
MSNFFIGLDIGGTNIRIASLDIEHKKVGNIQKVPFVELKTAQEEVETNICEHIKDYMKKNGLEPRELKGIGISCAPVFDRESGEIIIWPNNQLWNNFPLRKYLIEVFNVPVLMEDDANSAAIGEHYFGAGRGYGSSAYITVSTGIGCGLIINGNLYIGENGWAGEIGHIKVSENARLCRCGMSGCLQAIASGPALLDKSRQLAAENSYDPNYLLDLDKVVELAHKGIVWAQDVFDEAGTHLGNAIANIMMLLDIPLIVIGGGVAKAGDLIIEPIRKTLYPYCDRLNRKIEIRMAEHSESNGLLGALSLIFNHVEKAKMTDFRLHASDYSYDKSAAPADLKQFEASKDRRSRIAVINGPNMNLLGIREKLFYGSETLSSIESGIKSLSEELHVDVVFFQSNHEGCIIDFIQNNMFMIDAVVINPAAYTKTGYGILEALNSADMPFVEVHLSNIYSRGGWHAESIFAEKAVGQIVGFKSDVYYEGLRAIVSYLEKNSRHARTNSAQAFEI